MRCRVRRRLVGLHSGFSREAVDGNVRDLPGSTHVFFERGRLLVVARDELAVADLPGAMVDELHGLAQVQLHARGHLALGVFQQHIDERAHLIPVPLTCSNDDLDAQAAGMQKKRQQHAGVFWLATVDPAPLRASQVQEPARCGFPLSAARCARLARALNQALTEASYAIHAHVPRNRCRIRPP